MWNAQAPSGVDDYRLTLPDADETGRVEQYRGWLADVRAPGKPSIRLGLVTTSEMCWCNDRWRAYPLRA